MQNLKWYDFLNPSAPNFIFGFLVRFIYNIFYGKEKLYKGISLKKLKKDMNDDS